MTSLSVGKLRGLQRCATARGAFTILAFDHRQSFVKMLDPSGKLEPTYEQVVAAKSAVVQALGAHASAVLLDPIYGAAQSIVSGALPRDVGLLVAVEETGYTGEATARRSALLPSWTVEKIKRMGADAVKLLIYYHPEAGELAEYQEQLVRQVVADCQRADIALYLEAVSYSLDPQVAKGSAVFAAGLPALVAETARRLGALAPDVLKLEFPVDATHDMDETHWARACEAVSAASPCPWAVLSGGVNFELFARQVQAACQGGASGYIGGRAVWQEGIPLPAAERQAWLLNTGARRLDSLAEIADRYARPWTAFYPDLSQSVGEGWYQTY